MKKKNFSEATDSLARRAKKTENTFNFKGHQVQFELNVGLQDNLNSAIALLERNRPKKAVRLLDDSVSLLIKRNKLIRITDKSLGGWRTVNEYLSDDVASDSEDGKKIRAADNRDVRKKKTEKTQKRRATKRPVESSWSVIQTAHNGSDSNSFRLQPFRASLAASSKSYRNPVKIKK